MVLYTWDKRRASLVAQTAKRLFTMWKTQVWSLVREDPLEKEMAPTPVLLPGKSHGRRSLVGYSPWGRKELDTTERVHFHFHTWDVQFDHHRFHKTWKWMLLCDANTSHKSLLYHFQLSYTCPVYMLMLPVWPLCASELETREGIFVCSWRGEMGCLDQGLTDRLCSSL